MTLPETSREVELTDNRILKEAQDLSAVQEYEIIIDEPIKVPLDQDTKDDDPDKIDLKCRRPHTGNYKTNK